MPRADDPLAVFLYLLARDAVPWGDLQSLLVRATGQLPPELSPDDPLAKWAEQTAESLRRQS